MLTLPVNHFGCPPPSCNRGCGFNAESTDAPTRATLHDWMRSTPALRPSRPLREETQLPHAKVAKCAKEASGSSLAKVPHPPMPNHWVDGCHRVCRTNSPCYPYVDRQLRDARDGFDGPTGAEAGGHTRDACAPQKGIRFPAAMLMVFNTRATANSRFAGTARLWRSSSDAARSFRTRRARRRSPGVPIRQKSEA